MSNKIKYLRYVPREIHTDTTKRNEKKGIEKLILAHFKNIVSVTIFPQQVPNMFLVFILIFNILVKNVLAAGVEAKKKKKYSISIIGLT